MALTPGTRFGSFEILAPLGAGAMGEVYRARAKQEYGAMGTADGRMTRRSCAPSPVRTFELP